MPGICSFKSAQLRPNALEWRTTGAVTIKKYNKNKYLYFPLLGMVRAIHNILCTGLCPTPEKHCFTRKNCLVGLCPLADTLNKPLIPVWFDRRIAPWQSHRCIEF